METNFKTEENKDLLISLEGKLRKAVRENRGTKRANVNLSIEEIGFLACLVDQEIRDVLFHI